MTNERISIDAIINGWLLKLEAKSLDEQINVDTLSYLVREMARHGYMEEIDTDYFKNKVVEKITQNFLIGKPKQWKKMVWQQIEESIGAFTMFSEI